LIDYKAGSQTRWKEQAKLGFEDTQLAFYAALVGAATGKPVRAGYLPLEAREALGIERHREVEASGRALTEGVAIDITRLRGGAALRALGEGSVCEWCDVRGLCRRDDWQAEVQGLVDGPGEDGR
jgi:ATP-dependent helicase/nuclease subunit B